MGLRILHIAPFNISGVPFTFVQAERQLGHDSRLITLAKDRRNYPEDICLDLPFLDFWGTRLAKRLVSDPRRLQVSNQIRKGESIPLEWRPNGPLEQALIRMRERLWQKKVARVMAEMDFWNFDVYQLDGGLEFFRDGRTLRRLKAAGKKVLCCYTGSDLRTRGVIPEIDALADMNFTLEFDHLKLHPDIHHLFFPFDLPRFTQAPPPTSEMLRIGHAPTNRQAKGSDQIIAAVQALQNEFPVEMVLIERVSYEESLRLKAGCHVFIDQIGELGYGLNSLESLAMGIATCSGLPAGFEQHYPDHPFVVVDADNLQQRLRELLASADLRRQHGSRGRAWVQQHHDAIKVVEKLHHLAGLIDPQPAAQPFTDSSFT